MVLANQSPDQSNGAAVLRGHRFMKSPSHRGSNSNSHEEPSQLRGFLGPLYPYRPDRLAIGRGRPAIEVGSVDKCVSVLDKQLADRRQRCESLG